MKYFIDTEFLEGKQDKTFCGIKIGSTKPTIDLISIGIVSEDDRKYYGVSKDFNLKEAWNRYDEKVNMNYNPSKIDSYYNPMYVKEYWIRENVLKPIYYQFISGDMRNKFNFSYSTMKWILNNYGKTNKQIAEEIKDFVGMDYIDGNNKQFTAKVKCDNHYVKSNPQLYGYYSAYDYVALSWLFGRMIDLPSSFPMFIFDLKQELDNYVKKTWDDVKDSTWGHEGITLEKLKQHKDYPKNPDKHHALEDARFNKQLYGFLKGLENINPK